MRYGFCKEFSTPLKTEVDYPLIRMIREAGFDYVEMRAMLVAGLDRTEFEKLERTLKEWNLACDCCCALFPGTVRVVGKEADKRKIQEYLKKTLERCRRLGAGKVVFGSAASRRLEEGMTQEEGYAQLIDLMKEVMVPLCEEYRMTIVMEPLRKDACNFIHTLSDGMKIVEGVASERVKLLADTIHMMSNSDRPADILTYRDSLRHIHISELQRMLPEEGYSPYVTTVLENLKAIGYDCTISFETKNGAGLESMKKALKLLKTRFL